MPGTFISYRREDAAGYAGRLRESLERQLGRPSVFRDLDGLRPGDDFVRKIEERIAACRVMLVLIGNHWIDARDQSGARRLDDPLDFVRLEVSKALASPSVLVVPVLLESVSMPTARQLPEDLQALSRRHAISLRDETWDSDVARLVALINEADPSEASSSPAPDDSHKQPARPAMPVGAWVGIAVAVVLVAAIVGWRVRSGQTPSKERVVDTPQVSEKTADSGNQPGTPPPAGPSPAGPSQAVPAPRQSAPAPPPAALLMVQGPIAFEAGATRPAHLKVALLWGVDRANADAAYQSTAIGTISNGPDGLSFSLPIYREPSDSLCMKFQEERLGIGLIVAFDDANEDGLFQQDELIGGVPDYVVTFASQHLPEALRQFRKNGRPLETMLQLGPGLSLGKGVTPEEQGRPRGFDDVVPVATTPVTLVIVPKGKRPHFVNWT